MPNPHPSSKHVKDFAPPARLCGWSNQGSEKADAEAKRIHLSWIRRTTKTKSN